MNNNIQLTKEQEEKRLKNFKTLAEEWDKLPPYAQGKLDGFISATAVMIAAGSKIA